MIRLRAYALALALVGGGCSSAELATAPAGSQAQPIMGGAPDTQHTAVMALINRTGGACSGTTIAVRDGFGYLLTAAHCVVEIDAAGQVIVPLKPVSPDDLLVVPANDYMTAISSSRFYPVHEFRMHSGYSPSTSSNDVAVVRYVGADTSTPLIPHMTVAEDDLVEGTELTWVGYGQTPSDSENSVRYSVVGAIDYLSASELGIHELGGKGTCKGDSGGPSLRQTSNGERVAGVSSYGTFSGCAANNGYAMSMRVSRYQSFIDAFLGETPGPVSCDLCRDRAGTVFGSCQAETAACADGSPCAAFLSCYEACAGDATCQQNCASQNAPGYQAYLALFDCACASCPTECASEPACTGPACGVEFSDPTCNGCNEARCCDQTRACAEDSACRTCATSQTKPASCGTNELYGAFRACNIGSCGPECGVPCGFSNDGACGTCLSSSCCVQGRACAADNTCFQCATGSNLPECGGSATFKAFSDCLTACPGDPCGFGGAGGSAGSGGSSGGPDAGVSGDAGQGGAAAAAADAGPDGGFYGSSSSGCLCRAVPAAPGGTRAELLLLALGLSGLARRRRAQR
jgi:hypothetical protein